MKKLMLTLVFIKHPSKYVKAIVFKHKNEMLDLDIIQITHTQNLCYHNFQLNILL
jgi:hypothetical protein